MTNQWRKGAELDFREPENPQPDIVPEENNEIVEALDFAVPAEADEILVEKAEGIVVQKPAATAPSIMTEMKKAETSPAQESKSLSSKKRDLAGAAATVSQNHTIRGKVISADDDSPAPGVNVVVKGSSTGTITDIDGNYEISVPAADEATLVFSYIGYTTEEVELKKEETVVDVSLYADVTSLSEVVVVGYSNSQEETPAYSFTPPKPSGGQSKFNDYIKANLRYPASGLSTEIKGSVKVQFTITATGAMTNIWVIRSLGEEFDREALRLIQDGPRWEAAEENGNKVARDVKVTIRFKPPE